MPSRGTGFSVIDDSPASSRIFSSSVSRAIRSSTRASIGADLSL
jgi:hypothetical protein